MQKFSFFKILQDSLGTEYLPQTTAQEYWIKAMAAIDILRSQCDSGVICTNYAQLLQKPSSLLADLWYFTPDIGLPLATQPIPQIISATVSSQEFFLFYLSAKFAVLFVSNADQFLFSLYPPTINTALEGLKQTIQLADQQSKFAFCIHQFPVAPPDYHSFSRFTTALLTASVPQELNIPVLKEVDTIKAIAHEVKTPLTTIRTLIKSILRRQDVTTTIRHRLEKIDFECQDQIARFDLIFEIAKLEQRQIPLENVNLNVLIPINWQFWCQQAERREITLSLEGLEVLPEISTNKELLMQLLSGLVDRLTRSLPGQSAIRIKCSWVGSYIKILFESHTELAQMPLIHKAIGQWLMLQPDTGALSLSLVVTKLLFELIGGKLAIKTYPKIEDYSGEVLSVFLPIVKDGLPDS